MSKHEFEIKKEKERTKRKTLEHAIESKKNIRWFVISAGLIISALIIKTLN